jgi:hypothetical protein
MKTGFLSNSPRLCPFGFRDIVFICLSPRQHIALLREGESASTTKILKLLWHCTRELLFGVVGIGSSRFLVETSVMPVCRDRHR